MDLDQRIRLEDLREALWCLGAAHPNHRWHRVSGNPAVQLARGKHPYQPSEEALERGFRSLTPQGKALYIHWCRKEGLPVPEQETRRDPASRYAPVDFSKVPEYRI